MKSNNNKISYRMIIVNRHLHFKKDVKSHLLSFITIVLLTSCSNYEGKYEPTVQSEIEEMQRIENAEWLYFDIGVDNVVEKSGKYRKNIKEGLWSYTVNNDEQREIKWSIFENDHIQLNYPSAWEVIKDSSYVFFAKVQDDGGYFVILEKPDPGLSAVEYFSELYHYSLEDMAEELVDSSARLLSTKDSGKSHVLYDFSYLKNEEEWTTLGMITSHQNDIYDIAYRLSDSESVGIWQKVIFTDIINSLSIDSTRVVAPTENYSDVQAIEL